MSAPARSVTDTSVLSEYNTLYVNGCAHPADGLELPWDERFTQDSPQVRVGPYFLRITERGSNPPVTLQWWNSTFVRHARRSMQGSSGGFSR